MIQFSVTDFPKKHLGLDVFKAEALFSYVERKEKVRAGSLSIGLASHRVPPVNSYPATSKQVA